MSSDDQKVAKLQLEQALRQGRLTGDEFRAVMGSRIEQAVRLRNEGHQYRKIAEIMGVTVGTVAQYLHRAHQAGTKTAYDGRWAPPRAPHPFRPRPFRRSRNG